MGRPTSNVRLIDSIISSLQRNRFPRTLGVIIRLAIVSAPLDTAPLVSAPIELVCGDMGTTKAGMGDKML